MTTSPLPPSVLAPCLEERPIPQVQMYWAKTAGLYPDMTDIKVDLGKFNPSEGDVLYDEAQHALMKHVFETRGDEQAMRDAAEIIGADGNVQAMHDCFYTFLHAMGMAYQKSGWAGGTAASIAIGTTRFNLTRAWDGVHGFYLFSSEA